MVSGTGCRTIIGASAGARSPSGIRCRDLLPNPPAWGTRHAEHDGNRPGFRVIMAVVKTAPELPECGPARRARACTQCAGGSARRHTDPLQRGAVAACRPPDCTVSARVALAQAAAGNTRCS